MMIVEEIMRTNLISLNKDDTIETALKILLENHIRHIPIVDKENNLIGIISDRDIRDASPSILNKENNHEALKNPIEKIMTRNVITIHPLDFVEEISAIFYEKEIACLPVTKEGKLVGVVTEKDMLHTLIQLTGAHQPGTQIEIKVKNVAGMLTNVTEIIGKKNVNIHSVLVYPDPKDANYKVLVFRIQTMNPMGIIAELKSHGYTVLWPNLPGITL